EMMAHPPAHFDAQGTAGIINLKLKRGRKKGGAGNLTVGIGKSRYFRTNNQLSLSYNTEKAGVYANAGFTQRSFFQNLVLDRYYFEEDGTAKSSFQQHSRIKNSANIYNSTLGAYYNVSSK